MMSDPRDYLAQAAERHVEDRHNPIMCCMRCAEQAVALACEAGARLYAANEAAQTQRVRESHANTDLARANRDLVSALEALRDEELRNKVEAAMALMPIICRSARECPGLGCQAPHDRDFPGMASAAIGVVEKYVEAALARRGRR